MFALVKFLVDGTVGVVPLTWLKEDKCYWPDGKDTVRMVKSMQNPKDDWPLYKIFVKSVYATYDEARKNEGKYQLTSNLESTDTEDLGKGKRVIKRPYNYGSSPDGEDASQSAECVPPSQPQVQRLVMPPLLVNVQKTVEQPQQSCTFTLSTDKEISAPIDYEIIESVPSDLEIDENQPSKRIMLDMNEHQPNKKILEINESQLNSKGVLIEIIKNRIVLNEHGATLGNILIALNSINEKLSGVSTTSAEESLPVTLPLNSKEDVLILEEALNEKSVQVKLCNKLSQIGGISLGNMVRRMLARLMSNNLAMSYSWLGVKGKEPFAALKMSAILIDAVRRNAVFSSCSESEIENCIKDWLRHAKARSKE